MKLDFPFYKMDQVTHTFEKNNPFFARRASHHSDKHDKSKSQLCKSFSVGKKIGRQKQVK